MLFDGWNDEYELLIQNESGVELYRVESGRFDMSDNLMGYHYEETRTIFLKLVDKEFQEAVWDEALMKKVEEYIADDLLFDGYKSLFYKKKSAEYYRLDCLDWSLKISS